MRAPFSPLGGRVLICRFAREGARATETVRSAADRMREQSIAALGVKSGDAIAGLISERDIVHAVSRHGEQALSMAVLDIVPHATITVAPGDTLKRAMSLMTAASARACQWQTRRHRRCR
jgi:CBS domain-containing protein